VTAAPLAPTLRRTGIVSIALILALTAGACGSDDDGGTSAAAAAAHNTHVTSTDAAGDRIDPVAFHQDMRKLWEDHVTWTRLFIVSAIAGLPDLDATAGRLLQNQADIGEAIATFYGDDAGTQLTALLRDHILIAGDLVTAATSGDEAAVSTQSDRWYANADEIADFLAGANLAWPAEALRQMMRTHLDQTLAEVTARLHGDWAADVAEYDHIHLHILDMADALADGIVGQFPDRFTA
jgi:hypothetical protein